MILIIDMNHRTLDKLWSEAVKARSHRCEYCGAGNVSAHHIIGRTHLGLRWDVRNGVSLCQKHHTGSSVFSAHLTPKKFEKWIKEYRREDWEYLQVEKWNLNFDIDLDEVAEKLKGKLKGITKSIDRE